MAGEISSGKSSLRTWPATSARTKGDDESPRSILRREGVAVDRTSLAELDATGVEFSGVFAGAVDAGTRAGQGFEAGGGDGLAAEAATFSGGSVWVVHG